MKKFITQAAHPVIAGFMLFLVPVFALCPSFAGARTLTVKSAVAVPGESVTLPVHMSADIPGVTGFQFDVWAAPLDSAPSLSITGISKGAAVTLSQAMDTNPLLPDPGPVRAGLPVAIPVSGAIIPSFDGPGTLALLTVNIPSDAREGQSYQIDLNNVVLAGEDFPFSGLGVHSGILTVGSQTALADAIEAPSTFNVDMDQTLELAVQVTAAGLPVPGVPLDFVIDDTAKALVSPMTAVTETDGYARVNITGVEQGTATLTISSPLVGQALVGLSVTGLGPVITSAPLLETIPGVSYTYDVEAVDPQGQVLTYSLVQGPSGMAIEPSTGLLTWPFPQRPAGENQVTVTVQASDPDGHTATQTFTLFVALDADGDGYDDRTDCDDAHSAINPGAAEVSYDGIDNDCNAATLDNDLDQDLYLYPDDCDDTDPDVHPGAAEIPGDGVDNDCNPSTPDTLPDPPSAFFTTSRPSLNVASTYNGATAPGSSSLYTGTGSWDPQNIINPSATGGWRSASGQTENQWILIDLGGENVSHVLEKLVLKGTANGYCPKDIEIWVSTTGTDNEDFSLAMTGTMANISGDQAFVLPRPTAADYVKIVMLNNYGSSAYVSLYTFEAWTMDMEGGVVSVSQGPEPQVLGYSSQYSDRYGITAMLDGDDSTYWRTESGQSENQWVTLGFGAGKSYAINRVRMRCKNTSRGVNQFEILYSNTTADDDQFQIAIQGTAAEGSAWQEFGFTAPVTAKYIKFNVINTYGTGYVQVNDLEILTPEMANPAKLSGAGAYVVDCSSYYSGTTSPEKAIDFSDATYWSTASGQDTNQWITVLLNGEGLHAIDRIKLKGNGYTTSLKTFDFKVSQTGFDEADFTTVASGTLAQTSRDYWFFFPPVQARYVQLFIYDNYGSNKIAVRDFKVYASGLGSPSVNFNDLSSDPDGSIVSWLWDFGDGTTSTDQHPAHTYDSPGTYTVSLTVTDSAGLTADYAAEYTALSLAQPDFTFEPAVPDEGQTTRFTDNSTDPDGCIVNWAWEFIELSDTASGSEVSKAFPDNGDYQVRLTVTDSQLLTQSITKTVSTVNVAPVVTLPDRSALVLDPILINMTRNIASDESEIDLDSLSYFWNLGDGQTANTENLEYYYALPGVYTATLTVTDKDGAQDSDTATFTVLGRPTFITYVGRTSGDTGDTVTLRARLQDVDTNDRVPDKPVIFTVNGQTATAVTNDIGIAETQITLIEGTGTYTLTAAFAGDEIYDACEDTAPMTVPGLGGVPEDEDRFNSMVFTLQDIILFSYSDNSMFEILDEEGTLIWNNDGIALSKGEHAHVIVDQGVYKTSCNHRYSVLTGDAMDDSQGKYVGYFALDQYGMGVSKEFYTLAPGNNLSAAFAVFAYEDNTRVVLENADTGDEIVSVRLNDVEFWVSEEILVQIFVHVTADKGVSVLSNYDQGFYVPSANGTFKGTKFYLCEDSTIGGGWPQHFNITAFHDDTHVLVTKTLNGEIVFEGDLDQYETYTKEYQYYRSWITVTTDKDVQVGMLSWGKNRLGYHEGMYAPDNTGRGIGREITALTDAGSYLYVFGYEDDTLISVTDNQTGQIVNYHNINRGAYLNINPGKGSWLIQADKPIASYVGYGNAGADFAFLEFNALNPLSLTLTDNLPDDAVLAPGDNITYTVCYDNLGNPWGAEEVVIETRLPQEVVFAGASDSGVYDSQTHAVTWNIGLIPQGTAQTCLTVNVAADQDLVQASTLTCTCELSGKDLQPTVRQEDTLADVPDNQAPAAHAGGPYTVDEGSPVTLDASGSTDPDNDPLTYAWDLDNDGAYDDATGVSVSHTFMDNGTYPVAVMVSDADLTDTAAASVTVNDLAPVAQFTFTPGQPAEGSAITFTDTSTSAPDTIVSRVWNFGGVAAGTEQNPSFTFTADGTYTVSLTVTDSDGSTDTVSHPVVVTDLSPQAALTGDTLLNEGQTGTYDATASLSAPDAIAGVEWDWSYNATFQASGDTGLSQTRSWPDNGTFTIAVRVTDSDGSTDTATLSVTVQNQAPITDAGPDLTITEGESAAFTGSFTDPGLTDTHIITWDFGDGSSPESGSLNPDHTYVAPGTYTVTLTVTDKDGGTGTDSLTVTVTEVQEDPLCGDLDHDQDVDEDDRNIFIASFGKCRGNENYYQEADYDDSGCISLSDYQAWFICHGIANSDFDQDNDADGKDVASVISQIRNGPASTDLITGMAKNLGNTE